MEESVGSGHVYFFRCHYCITHIGDGMPVYMCKDASYCSNSCRRRGRRRPSIQTATSDTPGGLRQASSTSSNWSSAVSGSGDTTHSSSLGGASEKNCQSASNRRRGVLGWIFGEGLRKLTTFIKDTELLRSVSAVTVLANGEVVPRLGTSPSSASCSQDWLGEPPVQNSAIAGNHTAACSSSSGDAADIVRIMEGINL
mmetsp:Transcript_24026/g.46750  ORF Transcript_24026/g.46750 Transcript_24026/m.46750 type:complete len:198 (-) Transcript_24026:509-1102(-)